LDTASSVQKNHSGMGVDNLSAKYLPIIKEKSNAQFYYLIVRFVAELNNSHASKVPEKKGKCVVGIRLGDFLVTEKVNLEWTSRGKFTDEFKPHSQKSMMIESASVDYDKIEIEEKFRCSGQSRIKIPSDATVIVKDQFESTLPLSHTIIKI
jgi:hypothetical protein